MNFASHTSISKIKAENWPKTNNPLASYAFLELFELSGVTNVETGWQPLHLALYEQKSKEEASLLAVIPSYIKSHSYGEYVFDWAWADFYHRQGLEYYPKLLSATPVTPCLGPKILGSLSAEQKKAWFDTIIEWLKANKISSWHINFHDDFDDNPLQHKELIERHDLQFHWKNQNYQSFDEFIEKLKPKKRKNIRQERNKVHQAGWSFERIYAKNMTESQWELFYQLYTNTFAEKSGWAQLNLKFFKGLFQALSEQCLVIFAKQNDEIKAGSLFFLSDTHLYGRYWGAFEKSNGLHFETCYYQGIELAIELGLQTFEPGAQGEHKLARGFEPVITKSLHYISSELTREPIYQSIQSEKQHIQQRLDYYLAHSAYK